MGAVSIVRISGPRAFAIAGRLTGLPPAAVPPRALLPCLIRGEDGREIDSGLAAFFPAPKSYTGEDVAEIHLHGNPLLVERVAAAACSLGADPAVPGEFSRRAFLNGKMDLTEAEGVADLIAARTEGAARAALRQLKGGIGRAIAPLRERMLSLLLLLESSIDFADEEDVPQAEPKQLEERVSELSEALDRLAGSYAAGHRLRDGATVAIAGRANVGKSLLLNRIAGEERAIVTEIPGTTRDYVSAEVALGGIPVRLVDTAGLREPGDPVEREGVRRAREIVAQADLVLFVLDRGRPAGKEDVEAYRDVAERSHLLSLNKADLPAREDGTRFTGPGRKGLCVLSAKTGEGVGELVARIVEELAPQEEGTMAEAPLTRLRHVTAVRRSAEALLRAREAIRGGLPIEFVAADVREASRALSELAGEIAPDEVLDAVFESFCIGK
ncbi:MAG: tRNA uridine-5-carboxymethylaminomethyl(34) synthesis GTPase MnmE [Deltaproteobacteria bacterium]|nr:tRNA uridine-5-carboxymethylaminomethyl(34) synthesis GTPase MnmE [Deltaproteobacteria bacterium]